MTNPTDTLDRHARLAAEARALLHNGDKGPNVSQRERIDDILREIAGLLDETPKHPDNDLLSLARDVEEKAKKLLVHAMEFRDDWRKGDFELPSLAKHDMESMEAKFDPLWDALKAIATHRLKTLGVWARHTT